MYKFTQNSQDIIIDYPVMLKDGTQATTLAVNSFTTSIIAPDGTAVTDYTEPTITNPVSNGNYIAKFLTTADSLAMTVSNSLNAYVVILDHPETDVEPFTREQWIGDTTLNLVNTTVNSTNSTVGSIYQQVVADKTVVIQTVDLATGIPRIEAGDTYQFVQNFGTSANSVTWAIKNPEETIVATGTATQSGTSPNYYFFHTTTTSFFTTGAGSDGWHLVTWTASRTTGEDIIRNQFEKIRTTTDG